MNESSATDQPDSGPPDDSRADADQHDPRATDHPVGEEQAGKNADNEPAG